MSTDTLKQLGFHTPSYEVPRRMVARIYGMEKTGKTHLSLTAEEPIIYFSLNLGTEGVIDKFRAKEVYEYIPDRSKKHELAWNDLKSRLQAAFKLRRGTVVIDTESEMWEMERLASFGKLYQVKSRHYAEINAGHRDIVDMALASGMSAIFIQTMREEYLGDQSTGKMVPTGMKEMGYLVQMTIQTHRNDAVAGHPAFGAQITDCRQNASLIGRTLSTGELDFQYITMLATVRSPTIGGNGAAGR